MCLWLPFPPSILCASPQVQLKSFRCLLQLQKGQFILSNGEEVLMLLSTAAGLCILDETKSYLALLSSV